VQRTRCIAALLAWTTLLSTSAGADDNEGNPFVAIGGGEFNSALPTNNLSVIRVPTFRLQRHPVTNAEFLSFVRTHARWQRGAVPSVLADPDYLSHWAGALELGPAADGSQPVVRVSWFAAEAYCEAQQARLPRWYEWEFAAAADAARVDARADPAWRQQVLDWYALPVTGRLRSVASGAPNLYGLFDLHGLVWEWVEDFNSLLPADADPEKFCGSGAQNLQQKDNYAVLMRIALLGSLHGADTGHGLGFRCARDAQQQP
jgi:formylglycine-generating enzyme required for sulfatase activity